MIFYINGKFLDEKEAKISVYDLGLLRGYAVFDFLRTYNQKPFYLDDHLKRLLNSAKLIGLKHNYNLKFLRKITLQTLKKNIQSTNLFGSHTDYSDNNTYLFGLNTDLNSTYSIGPNGPCKVQNGPVQEYNIRIILTGGDSKDFITPSKPNLIVMIASLKKLDEKLYQKGGKLITKISERILPQAKTIIYAEAVKFMQEAKRKGAIEVLLLDKEKKILECTTSNFFVVMNRKLITPKDQILPGITGKVVINLAKKLKIPVIERDILFNEIKKFDEAFITASNKEILPIIQIDNFKISNQPGYVTKTLINEFKYLTQNYK
jgi:branched-chain amino acid aminotransferase